MSQTLTRSGALAGRDLAEEPLIEPSRSVPVGIIDNLGVDGESQPRIRVPEARLRSLDVDTGDDQLSAALDGIEHAYANGGDPMPDQPTWEMMASLLYMASGYE